MKIGVVKEGFQQANAEAAVNDKVMAAAKHFETLGATVSEVSIPMHLLAPALWMPIGTEGMTPDHDVGRRLRRQPARPLRHQP